MEDLLRALSNEATPGVWGQFSPSNGPWKQEAMAAFDCDDYAVLDTSHHMSTMQDSKPKRLAEWKHANDAAFAEALVNAYRAGKLVVNVDEVADKNQGTWQEFTNLIGQITYKPGWYFRTGVEIGGPDGSRMWVQIGVTAEADISWDMITEKREPWRGAKHYLSPHMCRQEVVGTVWHAIRRAEEHEIGEWFRYAPDGKKPRSIHNPHLDPDALAALAAKEDNFNVRENAMTMEEPK